MYNLEGWDEGEIVEGGQGRDGREVITYGWVACICGAAFFVWMAWRACCA